MNSVKSCIIPVAGLGSRLYPMTKSVSKEMLPIGGKPVIHHIVNEALGAGCENITIVTAVKNYGVIYDYFTKVKGEVARALESSRPTQYNELDSLIQNTNIEILPFPKSRGDGDSVLKGSLVSGRDEPSLIMFGDTVVDTLNEVNNAAKQLILQHSQKQAPIIATTQVPDKDVSKYGIVETDEESRVLKFLEKPDISETDSRQSAIGQYVLTPEIYDYLTYVKKTKTQGEVKLADAFQEMIKDYPIYTSSIDGERYDTGNELGLLKANIAYSLKQEGLRDDLRNFMKWKMDNDFMKWKMNNEK